MAVGAVECDQGHAESGTNTGDGYVFGDEEENCPDGDENEDADGHERDQDAGRCGDAFTSFEADPRGVVMPHDGGESGEDDEALRLPCILC